MHTNEHEREVLRQFIKREVQPLLDRIEKLEAEREKQPAPSIPRPNLCTLSAEEE